MEEEIASFCGVGGYPGPRIFIRAEIEAHIVRESKNLASTPVIASSPSVCVALQHQIYRTACWLLENSSGFIVLVILPLRLEKRLM